MTNNIQFDGFDDYDMDPNLESGEGVRIEYDEGKAFIIHRAGGSNRKFAKLFQREFKRHERKMQMGTLPENVAEKIMRECYAHAVVIGWEGITAGGEPVPFSPEACIAFFEARPEVFRAIQRDANDLAIFRKQAQEANEGNSETSSAGNPASTPVASSGLSS